MSRCVEVRRARPLLGTFVEICVAADSPALARDSVTTAFDVIQTVHRLMSFHDAESDVSRLNREAFQHPVQVHEWTWHVLARAHEFSVASRGAFDITIAPLLSQFGYLPKCRETERTATFRDLILECDRRVRFKRRLAIDLGGIAKGFAVDCAVETLGKSGIRSGIVNAGGDLRVFGEANREIHLRDPASPGRAAGCVQLRERALATSAVYFSRKHDRAGLTSPIVDGRSHLALVDDISVTVAAADCTTADALTTIVLARGVKALPLLHAYAADAIVLERGKAPRLFPAHAPEFCAT